jgi:hypothetical protein
LNTEALAFFGVENATAEKTTVKRVTSTEYGQDDHFDATGGLVAHPNIEFLDCDDDECRTV